LKEKYQAKYLKLQEELKEMRTSLTQQLEEERRLNSQLEL
jgi:hypothetical protein